MTVTKNMNLFPLKKNLFFKKMTVIPPKYEGFPTFFRMIQKKIKKINKNLFLARAFFLQIFSQIKMFSKKRFVRKNRTCQK